MVEAIENYVNAIPWGYSFAALLTFVFCCYSAVWSLGDSNMFGSSFYTRRFIRSVLGALCASTIIGWPIPIICWIIFSLPAWMGKESEVDQVLRYERERSEWYMTKR